MPATMVFSEQRVRRPAESDHKNSFPTDIRNAGCELGSKGMGLPPEFDDSDYAKMEWLRSEIIGGNTELETPFGKRRLTYADHTASGRCLHYIENYIIHHVLPSYGNCHTSDSYVGSQTTKMVQDATQYIKKCLGGGPNDALLFCGSGSTAAVKRLQEVMGIAIPSTLRERMLNCLATAERWVVFVGPFEHHSNLLSWRQSLAEVVVIRFDDDGLLDMEALKVKLEFYKCTNRPMFGSFSACSNVSGICLDTRRLAQLLHHYGAFACFDFAASGPHVEIDMRSGEVDGYDAIFLSPHKFIGGPGSPGILLMNKALYQLGSFPPSTCGGGTVDFVSAFNKNEALYVMNIEDREDAGTPPIIQKIRAALTFWVKEYIGYSLVMKQEQNYIKKALERLVPNKYIRVLGSTVTERQAILSFLVYTNKHSSTSDLGNTTGNGGVKLNLWKETCNERDKPLHGPFVAKLLNDLFGIQARGGCACAGPYGHYLLNFDEPTSRALRSSIEMGYKGMKPGWTRVSFPYYMSNEEFEFILAAIEFIALYGERFLSLYHFNWKTGAWHFKKKTFKETLVKKEKNEFDSCISTLNNTTRVEYDEKIDAEKRKIRYLDDVAICKYTSYLNTAKHVADLLPKFPASPQRVPEDLDADIVSFEV